MNAAAAPRSARSFRVLVAEDIAVNKHVVEAFLSQLQHEVVLTASGVEPLQALQRDRFGIVLLDVQMPVMDGLQATRLL